MTARIGGLAGWLIGRWRGAKRAEPRLQLVERIALGPRQSLALIDAEGRRILVATSAEGGPAFYPLGHSARNEMTLARFSRSGPRRAGGRQRQGISW